MKIYCLKIAFSCLLATVLLTQSVNAELSADAQEGEKFFSTCLACHDAEKEPALGPPMFGVKNWYRKKYRSQEAFINAIVTWVKEPTEDRVVMSEPFKKLGLMPAMPLPDDMLKKIALYMYETQFEPPCAHWKNVIAEAQAAGNVGQHVKQEMRSYDRLCK